MMPGFSLPLARRALAACLAAAACGCASLPSLDGRVESSALTATDDTVIGAAVAPLVYAHPGKTGVHAMPLGTDAFAARVLLAMRAQRSIDAQYYIWHADHTGTLLFDALVQAARRGVRVRILLDDQNTKGLDGLISAIAAEPNLEFRLYNPFAQRSARFTGYFGDFERLNRRMHNKAFIADNQVAMVGGRNIGDEYFDAGGEVPFKDLDVVALGRAVRDISREFDLYWNSASAYPAASLLGQASPDAGVQLDKRFAATRADPEARAYVDAMRDTPLVASLLERKLPLEWTDARLVSDDPAKTLDREGRRDVLLLTELFGDATRSTRSLDMISPYFVPGEKGTEMLEQLSRSGVRVRVLTNSLSATDVAVVHAGYAKRRCRLARAGVILYELKATVAAKPRANDDDDRKGSSRASLHAKTYASDGAHIFVGSFNFDPRSALLNTEMGLVIASTSLASRLSSSFDEGFSGNAYEVRARADGECIEWIERTPAGEIRHATEPQTGWARRAWLGFLELLPIDWML